MLADILEALKPRTETVELGGQVLTVRELEMEADLGGDDNHVWRLMVRCTFDAQGHQVMDDADIPQLKKSGKGKLLPLYMAVCRVNGLDTEADAKK